MDRFYVALKETNNIYALLSVCRACNATGPASFGQISDHISRYTREFPYICFSKNADNTYNVEGTNKTPNLQWTWLSLTDAIDTITKHFLQPTRVSVLIQGLSNFITVGVTKDSLTISGHTYPIEELYKLNEVVKQLQGR